MNDRFCVSGGRKRWSAELTAADVKSVLGVNAVSAIEITGRSSSGRAERLQITGAGTSIVTAETFRLAVGRKLGWDKIRSDLYEIQNSGGRFLFQGYGEGHGIGLCQEGAMVMGEQGFTYERILAYYYPNTALSKLGI
jgi:stage II sporulation protein D